MSKIIVNNRIVSDYTFATRFLSYLANNYNGCSFTHPLQEEEYLYMVYTAIRLLKEQVETCTEEELKYFKGLDPTFVTYKDIIKNHICENNKDFWDFLVRGRFL